MSKYLLKENVKTCRNNDKGYLYALVDIQDEAKWSDIDFNYDAKFPVSKDVVYIGMTSNPIERFSLHRTEKSKKIGMVIFNETKTEYPHVEAQMMENTAIFNYCKSNGNYPKWQKGAKTFSGA